MHITFSIFAIVFLAAADQTSDQEAVEAEQRCGNFGVPCSIDEKVIKEVVKEDWEQLGKLKEFN